MKLWILMLASLFLLSTAYTQNNNSKNLYKRTPALGIAFTNHDFQTAGDWNKTENMSPGLAISYFHGLSNHLDFMGSIGGTFISYPLNDRPLTTNDKLLLDFDANMNVKLLSDKYWVTPYLNTGIGGSHWNGYWGAYIPLGIGCQVNLFDKAYINLNAQYRFSITNATATNHLFYSLGIAGALFTKKAKAPIQQPPLPVVDSDKDGIVDSIDLCPAMAGLAQFRGCPDTDGDGVIDMEDKCPNQSGLVQYEGCPVLDSDGDGFNDDEDGCPNEAGIAKYSGCPISDIDGDTINDEEDKCPTVPGIPELKGCPKIEYSAQAVTFTSGSSTLTIAGKGELDLLYKFLHDNGTVNIKLIGHTDNTGSDKVNIPLSVKRAESAKSYLTGKGIAASRIQIVGMGSANPVDDNKTVNGRTKNRRIEFEIL